MIALELLCYQGNYLRVRGEYLKTAWDEVMSAELPPRARRILEQGVWFRGETGTTSACAENTAPGRLLGFAQWNYLRVRGEYSPAQYQVGYQVELPPRARRIPAMTSSHAVFRGTTSACAENTMIAVGREDATWNYLRVRGEYVHFQLRQQIC